MVARPKDSAAAQPGGDQLAAVAHGVGAGGGGGVGTTGPGVCEIWFFGL
jgi:hypothetical protein